MRESEGESGSWRSDRKARDREGVIERESESVREREREEVWSSLCRLTKNPPPTGTLGYPHTFMLPSGYELEGGI